MKILVDINHPAHIHYFRNFIKLMENNGHKFLVVSRNKEIEYKLLDYYKIDFIGRGSGNSKFGKVGNLFKTDYLLYKLSKIFKPDLFLSFMHPYPAQVSWLQKKPSIVLSDTESAGLHHKLTVPFASKIITPDSFKLDFGKKHMRFPGFMELFYLHPKYFKPDPVVLNKLNIEYDEKFIIIRFVSWKAVHDIDHYGLSNESKMKLVHELIKNGYKVFITSEGELLSDLVKYKLQLHPAHIHSVLYYASLFIGESGTMSTESSLLGTPSIQLRHVIEKDKLPGVHIELIKENLKVLIQTSDINQIIKKSIEILSDKTEKMKISDLITDKWVDPNNFLVETINNYLEDR